MPHTSEIPLSSSATWRDGARGGGDVRVVTLGYLSILGFRALIFALPFRLASLALPPPSWSRLSSSPRPSSSTRLLLHALAIAPPRPCPCSSTPLLQLSSPCSSSPLLLCNKVGIPSKLLLGVVCLLFLLPCALLVLVLVV